MSLFLNLNLYSNSASSILGLFCCAIYLIFQYLKFYLPQKTNDSILCTKCTVYTSDLHVICMYKTTATINICEVLGYSLAIRKCKDGLKKSNGKL